MLRTLVKSMLVGAVQSAIILLMARFVFHVPMIGSLLLLAGALAVYVVANLAVGYTFSTIAENQLQAMSGELAPPPAQATAPPGVVTYVLNPAAPMSSGKTIAQIAHAAVLAATDDWVADGCPAIVVAPDAEGFAAAERSERCVARVVDAGLTELPPGTLTVLALR